MPCPNANAHNEKIRRVDLFMAAILNGMISNDRVYQAIHAEGQAKGWTIDQIRARFSEIAYEQAIKAQEFSELIP